MADRKGIPAGRAFVEVGSDDSQLVAGLKKAQAKLRAFGAAVRAAGIGLAGVGGALTAPILAGARSFAAAGTAALDMSRRTGLSVEAISELGYAAKMNGADVEQLEVAIKKMQKATYEAATGSKSAQEALGALGLTAEELMRLKPEDQFQLIAERISAIKDPTLRTGEALAIFGKSGTQILPMLGNLGALRAEARRMGIMTTGAAKRAKALDDAFKALAWATGGVQKALGSAVAPLLTQVLQAMTEAVIKVRAWVKEHSEMVITALKVGAAITAVGSSLIAMGFAFTGAARALNVVIAPLKLAGMFTGLITAALSALVSPIGIAAVAVAGLGAAVLLYTDAGAKALQWLGDTFAWLRDSVRAVIQGITDALTAGDITAAAEVLWAALRVAWIAGSNKLNEIWLSAENWIVTQLIDIWAGIRDAFEFAVDAMARAWMGLTYGMRSAWITFSTWHKQAVEGMANFLAKAWVEIQSIFDPSINLEAAKESIDQQSTERFGEIEADRQKALNELSQQQTAAQRAADAEHLAQLRKVEEEAQKAKEALDAATTPQTAEAQAALEQARQRLADAVAAARQSRQQFEAKAPGKPEGAAGPGDLGAAVSEKISAMGSFNAAAVWGMATTPLNDIARNTAIANHHLERIEKKEAPRPAFA